MPTTHSPKRTTATATIFLRPWPPGISMASIGAVSSAVRPMFCSDAAEALLACSVLAAASASRAAEARSGASAVIEIIGTMPSVWTLSAYGVAVEYAVCTAARGSDAGTIGNASSRSVTVRSRGSMPVLIAIPRRLASVPSSWPASVARQDRVSTPSGESVTSCDRVVSTRTLASAKPRGGVGLGPSANAALTARTAPRMTRRLRRQSSRSTMITSTPGSDSRGGAAVGERGGPETAEDARAEDRRRAPERERDQEDHEGDLPLHAGVDDAGVGAAELKQPKLVLGWNPLGHRQIREIPAQGLDGGVGEDRGGLGIGRLRIDVEHRH